MSLLDFSLSDVEELTDELEVSFLTDMGDGGLFTLGKSPLAVTDVEEVCQDGRNYDSRGASISRYVEEMCGLLTPPSSPEECVTVSDSEDSDTESYTSIPWSVAISDFSESPVVDIEKDIVAACADSAEEEDEVPDCIDVVEPGDSRMEGPSSEENENEHCFSPFLSRKPRGAGTKKLDTGKRRKARGNRKMVVPEDTEETCRYPLRNRLPGRSTEKATDSNSSSQNGEDLSNANGRTEGCRIFDVSVKTVKDLNLKPCRVLLKRLELGAEELNRAAGNSGRHNAAAGVSPQVAARKSKADKPSGMEGVDDTTNGFQANHHGINIGLKDCVVLLERLSATELAQLSRPKHSLNSDQSSTTIVAIQEDPKVPKSRGRRRRIVHDNTELRRSTRERVIRKPWQIPETPKRQYKRSKKVNQPKKSKNRTNVQLNDPEISVCSKKSSSAKDIHVPTDESDEDDDMEKTEELVKATNQPRLILMGKQRSNLNRLAKSAISQKCPQLDWKSTALKIALPTVAIQQRRKLYFTFRAIVQELYGGKRGNSHVPD